MVCIETVYFTKIYFDLNEEKNNANQFGYIAMEYQSHK